MRQSQNELSDAGEDACPQGQGVENPSTPATSGDLACKQAQVVQGEPGQGTAVTIDDAHRGNVAPVRAGDVVEGDPTDSVRVPDLSALLHRGPP